MTPPTLPGFYAAPADVLLDRLRDGHPRTADELCGDDLELRQAFGEMVEAGRLIDIARQWSLERQRYESVYVAAD